MVLNLGKFAKNLFGASEFFDQDPPREIPDHQNQRTRKPGSQTRKKMSTNLERKPSLTAEELTPIVMNQLQNTNKMKEESRRQRLSSQRQRQMAMDSLANPKSMDSGSESCGEESRKRTAQAFMSGIQSAISASIPDLTQVPSGDKSAGANTPNEGLSDELVSEVESVLSKLMSSVNKGDPNLVPLIANLQSSLKATRKTSSPMNTMQKKVKIQMPYDMTPSNKEPLSPRTPTTPNSAQKVWTKDPFGSLPKRPQILQDGNFEPVHSKTFEPNPISEFESASTGQGVDAEAHAASKIPWKIRAARKRQMKHHTTGMTKDEFAQIQQSLRESAAKLAPKPVESYNLTRNKSEGSIQLKAAHLGQNKLNEPPLTGSVVDSKVPVGQLSQMPASYRQMEGNRAYTEACKGVDNMFPPSDLGYASDVCDYNVSNSKGDHPPPPVRPNSMAEDKTRRTQIQEDNSYLQQKRPLSMNRQESFDNSLAVPDPQAHLTRQSSTEEEGSRSTKLSRKNSKASSSGVKAKIARRKMMKNANAMDGAQGTISDPEGNSETNEGEDSVEEKQDNEPINEKQQFTLSNFTPTMSKKNWSSRFSNIKNSFDNSSGLNVSQDENSLNKSRSPSVGRQQDSTQLDNRGRSRTKEKPTTVIINTRSRSAHNLEHKATSERHNPTPDDRSKSINRDRAKSKEDKNKLNTITANSNGSTTSVPTNKDKNHSGRDSVDYHQYLEMIERFRGNNPKIYSHPLQKNAPANTNTNALIVRPQYQMTLPPAKSPEVSPSRDVAVDTKTKAEVMGLIKAPPKDVELNSKTHDMDYQEYMNIVNKVRATKEFTKLRTEQLRLSSMYDQERDRQQELKREEERLHMERAKIELEEKEGKGKDESFKSDQYMEPKTSLAQDVNRGHMDKQNIDGNNSINGRGTTEGSVVSNHQGKALKRQTSAEMRRLDEIHRQQLEQQKQQELRELQVRAEQERLAKLREEQIKQEKEREEIRRLEFERLQQIQEEQRRLEYERRRHEEQIRQEQQRLEEQRRKHEQLQAERNAQYNRQRLDMEAQNFASMEDHHRLMQDRLREIPETALPPSSLSPEEALIRERLLQQDRLREEHRREEAQIRQEKLNLIHQEEMLLARQDEMLRQIESDRETLTKQENLIRSRQYERLQQVRQEKVLLEKQEEMLKMREQQLVQEQLREEKLRTEQRILREQEEAIRKRQEEISKELMMGDLSDTGSESITICHPREGQVFMGKKPVPYHQHDISNQMVSVVPMSTSYQPGAAFPLDQRKLAPEEASGTEEDTLDEDNEEEEGEEEEEEEEEDYYQTQVEVQSKHTSVPTSVRTIETKLDNPPWAQVTPYLSYSEKQGQEEISDIFQGAKYTQPGVVTSPESMRASTTIITTPESSLQSQISQNDAVSISSSNPGSPPPPVPPLPLDPSRMPQFNSFVPVQPEVPPRNESFAATAGYSTEQAQAAQQVNNNPYQARRSLVEASIEEYPPNAYSPKIGGPGSAFKPYESTEPLFDPGNALSKNPVKSLTQRDTNNPPLHSKVKELRKPFAPPFSTTDTEPEMKECHMNTIDKKKFKQKLSSYSTSETEEEFQAYLKSRSKWHGKGGHKNSWDPLLLDSPPQITQKPLGIIPKPTPQAPAPHHEPVERGTQIVQTPIFIQPSNESQVNPIYEPPIHISKPPNSMSRTDGFANGNVERIQKSSSIIEVRSKNDPPPMSKERSPGSLPQSIADMNSKLEESISLGEPPASSSSMIPWAKSKEPGPNTPTSSVKIKQERFREQPEIAQHSLKSNATSNVTKKPLITHQRTNPTIAAMEIMTRKELALNEMEERRAREGMRKLSGENKTTVPQVNNQGQAPKKALQRQNEVISYALLPNEPRKIAETSNILKRFEDNQQLPLVTPHPSQNASRVLESQAQKQTHSVKPNNSTQTLAQENHNEKRENNDPRTSKVRIQSPKRSVSAMSSNKGGIASTSFMIDSPQPQRKLVATVKPSTARILPHEEDAKMTSDIVKKFAEKFESGHVGGKEPQPATSPLSLKNSKLRSKSIGNNLSQKMMELEEEKERIEAASNQNKTILPWANSNKAPVLRKRDAIRKGYELRMSKSSDHITAAKMLAEARMQENTGGMKINRDMSKSIERQIDVYTKTKDDIRKILQFAKVSSVNDRIKVFESQKPPELLNDEERDRKADAIKREIEEARELQRQMENQKISDEDMQIQDPVEYKVKPLKIRMKPKMIPSGGVSGGNNALTNTNADAVRGVPGAKLRINQRPGEEYKSEIRSILRNSSKYESLDDADNPGAEERRTSIENMPSIQSKIENYIQAAEVTARDAPLPPPISRKQSFVKSASLDRKKGPRLVHSNTTNNGQTMQIYAQSATDYSATEDETPDLEPHYLKTPAVPPVGLQKSKSFAGQFECILPEDEIDAKKRQMMAFFSDASKPAATKLSSSSQKVSDARSTFASDRRGSITSISDEILGEDRDLYLQDVDAAFESLLNGEDDEEDEDYEDADARVGTRPGKHLKNSRARSRDLSSGNGLVGVMSSNNSHSNSVQHIGGERVGVTRGDEVNSRKMLLPRQQTWTSGSANPPPVTGEPSPSPTQSVTRPNPVLGESDGNSPLQNLQGLQGEVQQIPSQGRPRMAATPNGSRLTRQASMPLSSFTGQQTYSFNRPPQPAIGNAPGGSAGNGGQTGSRPSIARSATSAKETILTWVQQQVNHYNNVNVTNFSTCWNDGLAFCALIHNFYPEAFDFSKLESRNRRYNFKLAFDVAEKYGDVCPLLDVDDMVKMTKPDWKCVFTYVQSFYRRFRNGREKVSPKRTLVLQRSPDREDPANVSALEMSIPWRGPAYSKTEFVLNPKPTLQPFEKFKNFQVPSLPKTDFKAATAAKVQSPMLSLSPKQSTNNFYQFSNTTPCNQLTRQQKSLLLQRQSSLPQSSTLQQQPPSVKHVRLQTSENQAQFQSHLSRNLSLISFISQRATNPSPPCSPLPALTPPLSQQRQHPTPIQPNNKALDSIGHAPFQRQPNHQGSEPSKRSKHFGGTTTFSRQRSTSPSTISFGSQSLRSSRQMSLPPMPKLAPPPPPPFL